MSSAVPTDDALLPARLRRPAGLAVAVAVLVFGVLAVHYAGTTTGGRVDARIDAVVGPIASPHRWMLQLVPELGSPPVVGVLALGTAVACLWLGRRRLAVLALLGPGLTGVATTLLKPAIGRTLNGNFAYPSGHTGGATAMGIVAALVVISLLRVGRALGLVLVACGAVFVGGSVSVAMIASSSHYPTDTIGGFSTAVAVVLSLAAAIDGVADRRAPRD
jgi:undecaprenyl-diphosphatase